MQIFEGLTRDKRLHDFTITSVNPVFKFTIRSSRKIFNFLTCVSQLDGSICIDDYVQINPVVLPPRPTTCFSIVSYSEARTYWSRVSNVDLEYRNGYYALNNQTFVENVPLLTNFLSFKSDNLDIATNYSVSSVNVFDWMSNPRLCNKYIANDYSLFYRFDLSSTQSSITVWFYHQTNENISFFIALNETQSRYYSNATLNVDQRSYTFDQLTPSTIYTLTFCVTTRFMDCRLYEVSTKEEKESIANYESTSTLRPIVTPIPYHSNSSIKYCYVLMVSADFNSFPSPNPPFLFALSGHVGISEKGCVYQVVALFNSSECSEEQTMTLGDNITRGGFENPPLKHGLKYSAYFVACFETVGCILYKQYPWYYNYYNFHSSKIAFVFFILMVICTILVAISLLVSNYNSVYKFSNRVIPYLNLQIHKTKNYMKLPLLYINSLMSKKKSGATLQNQIYENVNEQPNQDESNEMVYSDYEALDRGTYEITNDNQEDFYSLNSIQIKKECMIGKTVDNIMKNRSKDIVAYDETRVILDRTGESDQSDYINANYINGADRSKMYIAAQTPMANTVCDFWKMVTDNNCKGIVLLSRIEDKGMNKCEQYWPSSGILKVDRFNIECVKTIEYWELVCSKLKITYKNNKKEDKELVLWHIHFLDWEDDSVPSGNESLRFLFRKSRELFDYGSDTIVVNSTFGTGRVGTFICLDINIRNLELNKKIVVHKTIVELRHQRMRMVKTNGQYKFVANFLNERIQYPDCTYKLIENLTKSLSMDTTVLDSEYSKIVELKNIFSTLPSDGMDKVHYANVIYEKARFCPSYTKRQKFMMVECEDDSEFDVLNSIFANYNVRFVVEICSQDLSGLYCDEIPDSQCQSVQFDDLPVFKKFKYSTEHHKDHEVLVLRIDISTNTLSMLGVLTKCYAKASNSFGEVPTADYSRVAIISRNWSSHASLALMTFVVNEQMIVDGTYGSFDTTRRIMEKFPYMFNSKLLFGNLLVYINNKILNE